MPTRDVEPTAMFFRGINVGGHNKVPMATLREQATALGHQHVQTYIQSGNLLSIPPTHDHKRSCAEVCEALKTALGVETFAVALSRSELQGLLAANSFHEEAEAAPNKLLLLLYPETLDKARVHAIDQKGWADVKMDQGERWLTLYFPEGMGKSRFDLTKLDRHLGQRGTGRNWKTMTKVTQLLVAMDPAND